MANIGDLIGVLLQSNLPPSAGDRLGSALGELQRMATGAGAPGGGGAAAGGGALTAGPLGGLLDAALKGGLGALTGATGAGVGAGAGEGAGAAAGQGGAAGGLGALAGALLGGLTGGGSPAGAQAGGPGGGLPGMAGGAGMLAVLAGIAMQALQRHPDGGGAAASLQPSAHQPSAHQPSAHQPGAQQPAANFGSPGAWSGGDAPVALRGARNPAEAEALHSTATLIVQGMINAAKADGQISPQEMQRIVGKLGAAGADPAQQQWVMDQLSTPLDVAAFAASIPNQEVAAEVYVASLLAIEVDTDGERKYLQDLAAATGLHPLVVGQIHRSLGVGV